MADGKDKAAPQPRNHALTAALLGGAAAAAAGAVLSARAMAKRKEAADGKPLNAVMETAVTASQLAQRPAPAAAEPQVPREPKIGHEPPVG
jgi:hypothetical protein